VDELFRLGVENSLKLQADKVQESMAHEQGKTARTSLLPDLQIGLNGGVIGQPVVFQHGLSDATYPDTPDWSQNYAINFTQPLYQGGKIYNPQIEMFARFKMKSSFHKTKRII
jgi:outer membrane protein TolC